MHYIIFVNGNNANNVHTSKPLGIYKYINIRVLFTFKM